MVTAVNNESQVAHSRHMLANKGDVFLSFDVEDFAVPHGKDGEWRFTPLRKLRGLHNGTAADSVAASISVETAGQDGIAVDVVKHDDECLGHTSTPTDHVAAQAYSNFDDAHVVTFVKNSVSKEPVVIDIDDPGGGSVSYNHIVIDVQSHAEVVCVINCRGSGTSADNIELTIGDGIKLSVVTVVNQNEDAAHGPTHRIRVDHNVTLHHTITALGGEVVRIIPRIVFTAPGGDAGLLGMYFTDVDQYSENRVLVDHAVSNYRSNVMYKDALQGEPDVAHHEARITWAGDVLTRAEVTGTDTYKFNRSLLLTRGVRANVVPNLEIETGEIAGTGHAATIGRPSEGQLFYLSSCDIPELAVRRPVIRGFFSEVINLIPVESAREKLEKFVDEGLNTAGF